MKKTTYRKILKYGLIAALSLTVSLMSTGLYDYYLHIGYATEMEKKEDVAKIWVAIVMLWTFALVIVRLDFLYNKRK